MRNSWHSIKELPQISEIYVSSMIPKFQRKTWAKIHNTPIIEAYISLIIRGSQTQAWVGIRNRSQSKSKSWHRLHPCFRTTFRKASSINKRESIYLDSIVRGPQAETWTERQPKSKPKPWHGIHPYLRTP